jgi:hypothetical protein
MFAEQTESTPESNAVLVDQCQIFRLRHDHIHNPPLLIPIGPIALCIDVAIHLPVSIPPPPFRI